MIDADRDSADDLRNCPACGEWDAPVERLGQRTREDNVMVVGWRCLSCETAVSELVGDGKVSDMVDEPPKVRDPVTDGGVMTDSTERIGPGWYVIERPNKDPATVISGPHDEETAKRRAQSLTNRSKVMHTPALVYSIQEQGYNVEWHHWAEKPRSLRTENTEAEN